ncbi:hypothetical protein HNY73_001393 [Argiope bruennichi]|uniref:Uncharacterized protein n=1 Tax=Argiope bruennichi TaxID=94029 RepID=A0A8T0G3Q2_ARGBR|nr:hypothetical protein HNY73_001393 [Argiope bruennichi]
MLRNDISFCSSFANLTRKWLFAMPTQCARESSGLRLWEKRRGEVLPFKVKNAGEERHDPVRQINKLLLPCRWNVSLDTDGFRWQCGVMIALAAWLTRVTLNYENNDCWL